MPTVYKAQMVETETPWVDIWNRMYEGLSARRILHMLDCYSRNDIELPRPGTPLTQDEILELTPIVSALTMAAVESQRMAPGVQIATLRRIAKHPPQSTSELPGAIQWELARNHRRGEEAPGTFSMDIWGSDQTGAPYITGVPTPENLARAAEAAAGRFLAGRSAGRERNTANWILGEELGRTFRARGQAIKRSRKKLVREDKKGAANITYPEGGPFYDFLKLVLPPLSEFLEEHGLPPVTIESIVRYAASMYFE